jgi:hypothetical protein
MFLDSETTVEEFFADIHIPLDCEFLVAQRWGGVEDEGAVFSITELYRVHSTRALQADILGNWSSSSGLQWTDVPLYHRRRDLQGIVLKGAFIPDVFIFPLSFSLSQSLYLILLNV